MFKATITYEPYFYLATRVRSVRLPLSRGTTDEIFPQAGHEGQVEEWLMRKYEDLITKISRVKKEDLSLVRPLFPSSPLPLAHSPLRSQTT